MLFGWVDNADDSITLSIVVIVASTSKILLLEVFGILILHRCYYYVFFIVWHNALDVLLAESAADIGSDGNGDGSVTTCVASGPM